MDLVAMEQPSSAAMLTMEEGLVDLVCPAEQTAATAVVLDIPMVADHSEMMVNLDSAQQRIAVVAAVAAVKALTVK